MYNVIPKSVITYGTKTIMERKFLKKIYGPKENNETQIHEMRKRKYTVTLDNQKLML